MTSDESQNRLVRQLRDTKIYYVLSVVVLLGVFFLMINTGIERKWFHLSEPWSAVPWLALGEAFVSSFLIGVIYEGTVRRQSETLMGGLFSEYLDKERQAVISKLTLESVTSPDAVRKLTSEELSIATVTVLSARLGEEKLAQDIATTLFPQTMPNIELTRDYQNHVQLLTDHDLPDEPRRYFAARISVRYRRQLRRDTFRLGVSDELSSVTNRMGIPGPLDVVWHANRMGRYSYDNSNTFKVEYVRVNDEELKIDVSNETVAFPSGDEIRARVHTAHAEVLEGLIGKDVEISYCFVVKIPRLGHMLHFPLVQTCEGVRFEFDLGDVGIERATLIPFFLSASRPLIREDRFGGRIVISASTTSWVLPGGGIVLSWKLSEELDNNYVSLVYGVPGDCK